MAIFLDEWPVQRFAFSFCNVDAVQFQNEVGIQKPHRILEYLHLGPVDAKVKSPPDDRKWTWFLGLMLQYFGLKCLETVAGF